MERRARVALEEIPAGLRTLETSEIPLLPFGLVGIDALRGMRRHHDDSLPVAAAPRSPTFRADDLGTLVDRIARRGHGVVMTMGKGGVGKTTIATRIAIELARHGLPTTLTTTDPAAHVAAASHEQLAGADLCVTRIDPALETRRYSDEVLATAGAGLDAQGRALLAEDLRSPCTEEIAVFRAFADTVAQGQDRFVVIDTAPTGHTLLLLDAAEAYHREVLKKPSGSPEAVLHLLPRLRDPELTHVLLVTLPEATPIHEAMQLERDLARADIKPFAWVVNQSLIPHTLRDPVLRSRQAHEAPHLEELARHGASIVLLPWATGPIQPRTAEAQTYEATAYVRAGVAVSGEITTTPTTPDATP